MSNNIYKIVENAICTGCGACSGICPENAISIVHNQAGFLIAKIDEKKCINCGMCLNVCPSNCENQIINKCNNIFYGEIKKCYIGYSCDQEIRKKSQSGGVVTSLLLYLIDKKKIDGALVNQFDNKIKKSKIVLAKSKKDLIKSCGSIYIQSPVTEAILKYSKTNKIAAVLLGCQAESLKLINEKYPSIKLPYFTIGLFCAGQNSSLLIEDLISQNKYDFDENICDFRFRDKLYGNWPGNIKISTNKKDYEINKQKRHDLKPIYESFRCLSCYDQLNIYSDISVGDPWGIEKEDIKKGYSVIIVRSTKAIEIIEDAVKNKYINIEEISKDEIIKGQTIDTRLKDRFYNARFSHSKNNWLYPYKKDLYENNDYLNNTNQNNKAFETKSKKLRDFFMEDNQANVIKHIKNMKNLLYLKKIYNVPKYYYARIISKLKNIFK